MALVSYYGGTHDAEYEDEIRQHFPGAQPINDRSPQNGLSLYIDAFAKDADVLGGMRVSLNAPQF